MIWQGTRLMNYSALRRVPQDEINAYRRDSGIPLGVLLSAHPSSKR